MFSISILQFIIQLFKLQLLYYTDIYKYYKKYQKIYYIIYGIFFLNYKLFKKKPR